MTLNLPDVADNLVGLTQREDAILSRVAGGNYDPIPWTKLTSSANGHTAELLVTPLPLSLDGVFVGVGAATSQRIADVLGALLVTPRVLDLMWQQRTVTVPVFYEGVTGMMSNAKFEKYTADVKSALSKAGYTGGIAQSVGKPFVLIKSYPPGMGANYGWHFTGPTWDGKTWEPSASLGAAQRVVQGIGTKHGLNQDDYASTGQYMHRYVVVDGRPMDLVDVLIDPELAPLASHEGAFPTKESTRQPGVAVFACAAPDKSKMQTGGSPSLCPTPNPPSVVEPPEKTNWGLVAATAGGVLIVGGAFWLALKHAGRRKAA